MRPHSQHGVRQLRRWLHHAACLALGLLRQPVNGPRRAQGGQVAVTCTRLALGLKKEEQNLETYLSARTQVGINVAPPFQQYWPPGPPVYTLHT